MSRSTLSINIAMVIVSTLIGIALSEGALRVHEWYITELYSSGKGVEHFWDYDPLLGWKNTPDVEEYFINKTHRFRTLIKTNPHGLRDKEYSFEKPSGVTRVLLIGDSYPVGFEIKEEHLVDRVVEAQLGTNQRVEVINAGVRGYGSDQCYIYLTSEGFNYQPDVVIYFFTGNDPRNNIVRHKPFRKFGKPYFTIHNGKLQLNGVPVPMSFQPHNRWLMSRTDAEDYYNSVLDVEVEERRIRRALGRKPEAYDNPFRLVRLIEQLSQKGVKTPVQKLQKPRMLQAVRQYEWNITTAIAGKMKEFCEKRGVHFVIYEISPGHTKPNNKSKIERIAEKGKINIISTRQRFYEKSGGTRKFCFKNDLHWNEEGHYLAGSIISEYLVNNKLVFANP